MTQNESECLKMNQNETRWLKITQNDLNWCKTAWGVGGAATGCASQIETATGQTMSSLWDKRSKKFLCLVLENTWPPKGKVSLWEGQISK